MMNFKALTGLALLFLALVSSASARPQSEFDNQYATVQRASVDQNVPAQGASVVEHVGPQGAAVVEHVGAQGVSADEYVGAQGVSADESVPAQDASVDEQGIVTASYSQIAKELSRGSETIEEGQTFNETIEEGQSFNETTEEIPSVPKAPSACYYDGQIYAVGETINTIVPTCRQCFCTEYGIGCKNTECEEQQPSVSIEQDQSRFQSDSPQVSPSSSESSSPCIYDGQEYTIGEEIHLKCQVCVCTNNGIGCKDTDCEDQQSSVTTEQEDSINAGLFPEGSPSFTS